MLKITDITCPSCIALCDRVTEMESDKRRSEMALEGAASTVDRYQNALEAMRNNIRSIKHSATYTLCRDSWLAPIEEALNPKP